MTTTPTTNAKDDSCDTQMIVAGSTAVERTTPRPLPPCGHHDDYYLDEDTDTVRCWRCPS